MDAELQNINQGMLMQVKEEIFENDESRLNNLNSIHGFDTADFENIENSFTFVGIDLKAENNDSNVENIQKFTSGNESDDLINEILATGPLESVHDNHSISKADATRNAFNIENSFTFVGIDLKAKNNDSNVENIQKFTSGNVSDDLTNEISYSATGPLESVDDDHNLVIGKDLQPIVMLKRLTDSVISSWSQAYQISKKYFYLILLKHISSDHSYIRNDLPRKWLCPNCENGFKSRYERRQHLISCRSVLSHRRDEDNSMERPRNEDSSMERPRDEDSSMERPRDEDTSMERQRDEDSSLERPRDTDTSMERPRDEDSSMERPRDADTSMERPRDADTSMGGHVMKTPAWRGHVMKTATWRAMKGHISVIYVRKYSRPSLYLDTIACSVTALRDQISVLSVIRNSRHGIVSNNT